MMKLAVSHPGENFHAGPNIKFYSGYLNDGLKKYIDQEKMKATPGNIITDIPAHIDPNTIPFHLNTRHQESNYNDYKKYIRSTTLREDFVNTKDLIHKQRFADEIIRNFRRDVGIDSQTGLSKKGHEKGEESTEFYKKFWADPLLSPFFPTRIMVSPYSRAKETLLYALKGIDGLKMDLSSLHARKSSNTYHSGITTGTYYGKNIVLKETDILRERNHGYLDAPRFVIDELNRFYVEQGKEVSTTQLLKTLLSKEEKEREHYFNGPNGGEAMTETCDRSESRQKYLLQVPDMSTWSVSHHLVKVADNLKTMGGGYQNFRNFNDNRKPDNGSVSIMVKIPVTESGHKNKMRMGAYNLNPTL